MDHKIPTDDMEISGKLQGREPGKSDDWARIRQHFLKESLQDQANEIELLLKLYVKVHNSIKKQGGFLSLFKHIDFHKNYELTDDLFSFFVKKKNDLIIFKSTLDSSTPEKYIQYFQQLIRFYKRLYETVALLREQQYKLLLKSNGGKYDFEEFANLGKRYTESIKVYMEEARKLNKLNYLVFD